MTCLLARNGDARAAYNTLETAVTAAPRDEEHGVVITEAVIEEQLRPHGVPEEILTQLHELFHACNQARYAPQHTLPMLVALAPRAEAVLRELQQLPDPAPAKGNA